MSIGDSMKNFSNKLRINARVLVAALIVILILSGFKTLACYSPADAYAVEVVLNKPGVKYNLAKLAEMGGVVAVNYFGAYSAYVYRSRYDDRLVVIVSEQGLKYANMETSDTKPSYGFVVKGLDVNPKQISENVEKARGELGWNIETPPTPSGQGIGFVFTKMIGGAEVKVFLGILEPAEEEEGGEGYTVKLSLLVRGAEDVSDELASKIKLEISNLLDKIGLPQLKEFLKSSLSKTKRPPEQEKYLGVRIQIPLKLKNATTTTVHVCSISGRFNVSDLRFEVAENLEWSVWVKRVTEDHYYVGFAMSKSLGYATLYVEGKSRDSELYLSLRVEGVSSLSDAVLDEFKKVLKAVGLGEDLVGKCSFEKFEEPRGGRFVPAYDVGEEDIRKALRAELKWLSESGVISGLSEDDIETIVSTAKLGYAGWNSRLVWSEGGWIPYGSTEGAVMLRCVGVPPSFFMVEEEVVESPGQASSSGLAGESYDLSSAALYLTVSVAVALMAGVAAYLIARRSLPVEN